MTAEQETKAGANFCTVKVPIVSTKPIYNNNNNNKVFMSAFKNLNALTCHNNKI